MSDSTKSDAKVVSLEEARRARRPGFTATLTFEGNVSGCTCLGEVLGFEQGLLWARLEAKPESWRGTYRTANVERLEQIAAHHGYEAEVEPSDDPYWQFVTFTPATCRPSPG